MARTINDIDPSSLPTLWLVARTIQENAARLRDAGIERIAVFGSVARGEDREDSDVDLLIVPQRPAETGGLRLAGWRNLLSDMLGREVDVVVDKFLRDDVKNSILAEGVEVFRA